MSLGFEERVVIVTGAGNGLGRRHALEFAARGARLVVNDLGGSPDGAGADASSAEAVAAEIRAAGGTAIANCDSVLDGDKIVQCAMDAFGKLDVLVNNAGILRDTAFHKMDEADWRSVIDVHLNGAYRMTRAAWPHMRGRNFGRVIMTSSAAGIYGNFGQANYSAAKLGLFGLAQSLAIEGASKGILVNTIAPVAASRLTRSVMPERMLAALDPALVAPLVLWLAHETCTDTGQLFEAGGGWIGRVRWERSEGVSFDPHAGYTLEDLAQAWAAVQDFSRSNHPRTVADAFAPLERATGVSLALQRQ